MRYQLRDAHLAAIDNNLDPLKLWFAAEKSNLLIHINNVRDRMEYYFVHRKNDWEVADDFKSIYKNGGNRYVCYLQNKYLKQWDTGSKEPGNGSLLSFQSISRFLFPAADGTACIDDMDVKHVRLICGVVERKVACDEKWAAFLPCGDDEGHLVSFNEGVLTGEDLAGQSMFDSLNSLMGATKVHLLRKPNGVLDFVGGKLTWREYIESEVFTRPHTSAPVAPSRGDGCGHIRGFIRETLEELAVVPVGGQRAGMLGPISAALDDLPGTCVLSLDVRKASLEDGACYRLRFVKISEFLYRLEVADCDVCVAQPVAGSDQPAEAVLLAAVVGLERQGLVSMLPMLVNSSKILKQRHFKIMQKLGQKVLDRADYFVLRGRRRADEDTDVDELADRLAGASIADTDCFSLAGVTPVTVTTGVAAAFPQFVASVLSDLGLEAGAGGERGQLVGTGARVSASETVRATVAARTAGGAGVGKLLVLKFVQYSSSGLYMVLVCETEHHEDYFGTKDVFSIYQSPESIKRLQKSTPKKGNSGQARMTRSAPTTPAGSQRQWAVPAPVQVASGGRYGGNERQQG
jgi:hypothetical protein